MTVFVYSAGKLAAEYSTAPPEQNPTTKWTVTDQLGSPRVLVNSLGEVVSRRDFMPFGEEITPDGTHRTADLKYNFGDNIRQKFTGYQKDEETQLDFAEARMYQNLHGRFTAVDPLLASGKSANPQTFNRYVYVMNNPLIYTDPTGLQAGFWYMPVTPDGDPDPSRNYEYILNGRDTNGFQLVTQKNQLGELIGTGNGLPEGFVIRFNPFGPVWVNNPLDLDDWLINGEYTRNGWDVIRTDEAERLYRRSAGLQDTSLEVFGIFQGGIGLAQITQRAARGSVLTSGTVTTNSARTVAQETFYRSMSEEAAEVLLRTGRMPAGTETFITTNKSVAEGYRGVLFQFETRAGTTESLKQIGVRNSASAHPYPEMPLVTKGWKDSNAFFKLEEGKVNIGLGNGEALNRFNNCIITCRPLLP